MDFSNRSTQHASHAANTPSTSGDSAGSSTGGRNRSSSLPDNMSKWLRIASVVLLFSITILLIAVAISLYTGGNSESKYLQKDKFQAVDISVGGSSNSDQIYFGNIKQISDKYFVLDNVYYIPSSNSSSNITLQPLVCQVDKPFNRMVVNRTSVNWWENLQSDGQVAKAIASYQKSNPNGPTCPKNSSSSNSSSSTSSNSSSSSSNSSSSSSKPSGQ